MKTYEQLQTEVDFLRKNFLSMIKQRGKSEIALRNIRDGKDNPSYLSRNIVGQTQWRG